MTTEPNSSEDQQSEDQHTALGLAHLVRATMVIVACVGLAYVVPGTQKVRPWNPGDPPLFAGMFGTAPVQAPSFAGTTSSDLATDRARIAAALGDAVASNLGADEAPVVDEGPMTRIAEREYAGITQRIEDPTGEGMRPFYEALLRTAEGEPGAMTRAAHYGDSSIATDLITHTIRRRLQRRFGDGGHGFVLIARGYLPYYHRDLSHTASDNWRVQEVTRAALSDGHYGFGGIAVRGGGGARASFGPDPEAPVGREVSRFDLYYRAQPRGGRVELRANGGEPRVLDTAAEVAEDRVESVVLPQGDNTLVIRPVGGQVQLYGMALETDGPGVVYDSLGLVGARANRLLNFDAAHVQAQLARRGTNLLVLGFGGNEASDSIQEDRYFEEYVQVIDRMRGERKDLACLIVAPLDQAERTERGVRTFRAIPRIVAAQQRAAAARGCAFYNTFEAMGGEGAMREWYSARPRLALGDFRHATPAGYEVIGNMIYKALLAGFADYLSTHHAAQPESADAPAATGGRRYAESEGAPGETN